METQPCGLLNGYTGPLYRLGFSALENMPIDFSVTGAEAYRHGS